MNDADADPTNEMNTGVVLNGTDLEVTDGNGTIITDLSPLQDGTGTDDQNISGSGLSGTDLTIGIEGGISETVDLSSLQDGVNDADADPNNEIQAISFSNDTLYLLNGGQVYLGAYGIDLVDDADSDPSNELQVVSLSNDTLYLSNGNNVYIGNVGATNISGSGGRPSIGSACNGGCWSLPGWNIGTSVAGVTHSLNAGCGFIPIYIDKQTSFQSIGGVFNPTNLCRLAIYSWNNGFPDTLIVDFGLTPGGATPTIINSFSLQQGFYFIAVATDNGVSTGGAGPDAYTPPVSGKTTHLGQLQSKRVVLLQTGAEFVDYTTGFPPQIVAPFSSGYGFFYRIRLKETP